MPMHYGHPEDGDKLCRCPRCGWSGTLHQTDEFTPASGGESFQVCPKCAPEVPVAPWGDAAMLTAMQWWNGLDDGARNRWILHAAGTQLRHCDEPDLLEKIAFAAWQLKTSDCAF